MTPQDISFYVLLVIAVFLCIWIALDIRRKPTPTTTKAPRTRSTKAPVRGDLLRPKEVSRLTGIPRSTLCMMREDGRGPKWFRDGRPIYYKRSDVEEWMVTRRQESDQRKSAAEILGIAADPQRNVFDLGPSKHNPRNAFLGDDDPADGAVRA